MKVTIEFDNTQQAMIALGVLDRVGAANSVAASSPATDAPVGKVLTPLQEAPKPPTPPAPAPAPAPVEAAAPAEVDKRGFPWDARIHGSNGKMTADGVWQKRRGVTASQVAEVESELKGAAPLPAVPAVPAAPAPVPTPAPATGAAPVSFAAVVQKVTTLINTREDLADTIVSVVQKHAGTSNIMELEGANEGVLGAIFTELEGLGV